MVLKKTFTDTLKIALSLLLGGAILYWMYRDFDFRHIRRVLLHEMNWWSREWASLRAAAC